MLCEISVKNYSNIAGGRIDKRLNYLLGIFFFGLLKIQIILKRKVMNFIYLYFIYLFFIYIYIYISYSYSLHNLNRSGFLYDNSSSFELITRSVKFHRYLSCTLYNFYFKCILFTTQIGQNLRQNLTIWCCYQCKYYQFRKRIIKNMESFLTFYSWRSVIFS